MSFDFSVWQQNYLPVIRPSSLEILDEVFNILILSVGKVITPSIITAQLKGQGYRVSHNTVAMFLNKMVESGLFRKLDRVYVRNLAAQSSGQSLGYNATYFFADESEFPKLLDDAINNHAYLIKGDDFYDKRAIAMVRLCSAFIDSGYNVKSGVIVYFGKDGKTTKKTCGIDFIAEKDSRKHYYVMEGHHTYADLERVLLRISDNFPKTIISLDGTSEMLESGIAVENADDIINNL